MSTASAKPKKMGRPPKGVEVLLGVKISPEMAEQLDTWAAAKGLSKSEAVRLILARTLKVPATKGGK